MTRGQIAVCEVSAQNFAHNLLKTVCYRVEVVVKEIGDVAGARVSAGPTLLGPTSQRLITRADVSVIVVRPDRN